MIEQLAAMPTYEAYKDSGVEWLREIPAHWQQNRFKFVGSASKGKLPKRIVSIESADLPAYMTMDYLRGGQANQWILDSNLEVIESDEVLLLWDGSNSGEFLKSKKGVISSTVALIKFKGVLKQFGWYFSSVIERRLRTSTVGMGIPHVNGQELINCELLIPTVPEQLAIATFLDRKTAQIDQAVAIKEQQIALLKERKQILIQNAVTRGLDHNVPMRDSGVEWIGEIPAHWEVTRLKYIFSETNERTKTGQEVLFSLRMEQGLVPHNDVSDKHIADDNLIDYKIIRPGQMIMNRMRAAIGIFGLADKFGLVSPDYAVFNIGQNAFPDYFLRLFKTPLIGEQFRLNSKGLGTGSSGFMRLYTENFGDIKVPLPSKEEQVNIVTYTETHSAKIEQAIAIQQQQIDKLKEYKATLINSAVTGKIRVPEVAV